MPGTPTKTDVVKHVPVHGTLAAVLADWKLRGWPEMMGRAPEPDDLIVPLPPADAAKRRRRSGEPFRGTDYSYKRWSRDDLPALGMRHRRHYDMRATFITLALEDGADADVLEHRVTHTKKRRSAFDGYDRGVRWAKICAEVAKLRISRRHPDRVTARVTVLGTQRKHEENVVEAAGVEDEIPGRARVDLLAVVAVRDRRPGRPRRFVTLRGHGIQGGA